MTQKHTEKICFIYADQDRTLDEENYILLDTYGTQLDMERYGMVFEEGKRYWFWRDDLKFDPIIFSGTVHFNLELQKWTANIDKDSGVHYSESKFKDKYKIEDIIHPINMPKKRKSK